ncbi:MAG TPA: hypothetical protein VJY15_22575 [Candidatus Acidoferrum sp.]|nr:hypothetical protein [Candidatus Acidoferrum sp.]
MQDTGRGPDLRNPTIPPIFLAIGSILWRLIDWAARIDFVLSIQNQSFAVIFQAFASYGWLAIVAICVLWWYQTRKQSRETGGEYRITWGLVISVGILAFLYGVLLSVYATGSVPNVIVSYGRADNGCQSVVDTSRLSSFKDSYNLVVACGITNPTVDQLEEKGISISSPFNIKTGGAAILTPYSPAMAAEIKPGIVTGLWFYAILVPKDIDLSKCSSLSELQKQGGRIVAPGLF